MQWRFDRDSGTYSLDYLTSTECGTLCAAVLAGYAITTVDTYGAEAARRNLMAYQHLIGEAEFNRMLAIVIAADAHRIQNR